MKADALIQHQFNEPVQQQISIPKTVPMYFLWEQHNITINRSPQGYGIAISGGSNNCGNNPDASIYVSDVVSDGPAYNKLMPDDRILSVNGVNVENVEHEFVIRLLKEAKDFIHLVIKRKTTNSTHHMNNHQNGQITSPQQQQPSQQEQNQATIEQKRHNLAIQQTAATVMANYSSTYQNGHPVKPLPPAANGNANLMSNMMNSSHSISSLKPIKLTFNRKDKKEIYGIVVGCKYYIKEILPDSLAASEANLKLGDLLLKLNDFDVEQISVVEANRILSKSKENKLHLVVKRGSVSSFGEEDDELANEPVGQITNGDIYDHQQQQSQQAFQHSTPQHNNQIQQQQYPTPNGIGYQNMNGSGLVKKDAIESPAHNGKMPPPLPPTLPPQPPHQLPPNQQSTPQRIQQQQQQPSCSVIKQLFKQSKQQPQNGDSSRLSKFYSNKNIHPINYRTVVFARENGIGIRLAGGNKVGIFICDVQYNSPAERAGLRIADKIVRVNGLEYESLTREEAVQHILSIQSMIEMVVGHAPQEYEANAFDPHGGDSFYVRAHFNYASRDDPNELAFQINDILHVTDTLFNGVIGQWVASKLNTKLVSGDETTAVDVRRGTVPNQERAEKLVVSAQTIDQVIAALNSNDNDSSSASTFKDGSSTSNGFASLGASARMSIRKRLAGKNSIAKRSRSASRGNVGLEVDVQNPNLKVSRANTYMSDKFGTFERVVLREVNFARPIVLFGPLADVAREKLKSEFPNKYEIPESYSTNPNDPNSQSSGVIKLASIKAIIEKGKHSLLDITPNAVDHLNYAQYFPICIYLKANSRNHTKDLRQKYAKNLKAKSSRRLYDNALKLEAHYSHLFTATMPLDSNQWFKKLKDTIELQQSLPVWISEELESSLNAAAELEELEEEAQRHKIQDVPNEPVQQQQQQSLNQSNHQNMVFDDNFEFPIYTAANQPLSMCGAASSTYSLYEDSGNYNRSSFAASDSDLCGSVSYQNQQQQQHHQKMLTELNQQQQQMASIYSTNFNNKTGQPMANNGLASTSSNSSNNSAELNSVNTKGQYNCYMPPSRAKSDSNMAAHHNTNNNTSHMVNSNTYDHLVESGCGNGQSPEVKQQYQQHVMNAYEANNVAHNVAHNQPNFYNSNEIDQRNLINQANAEAIANSNNTNCTNGNQQTDVNNWKKFATYSANSLRNLTNKLLHSTNSSTNGNSSQDQLSDSEVCQRKKPATVAAMSQQVTNGSSKLYNANLNGSSPMRMRHQQIAETTSQQHSEEVPDSAAVMRNSSLSNYILIKNSQSSLMGNTCGAQLIHKQIVPNGGSLLLPTNLVHQHQQPLKQQSNNNHQALDAIEARMNDLKLSCTASANKNICHEQTSLFANEIKNFNNNMTINNADSNSMIQMNGGQQNMINNTNNNRSLLTDSSCGNALKRKKDSTNSTFAPKPPPTLPKPKFILPQSSTTNMVLQRNLKAKSELNIATTNAAASTSSASSTTSSQQENDPSCQLHQQQNIETQLQQQQMVAPIRNKFLENNSIVSSSQGYHSDAWESSHSSHQLFNDEKPVVTAGIAKRYAQRIESKLAKTTVLNNNTNNSASVGPQQQQMAATETLVSSNNNSDDNESIPNEAVIAPTGPANHHQYYNVQTKSILIQKPPTSSSSTVSTSSNSSSSSGSGGGVFSSGQTTFSTTSSNCFSSSNMDSPNVNGRHHINHHNVGEFHQVHETSAISPNNNNNNNTTTNNGDNMNSTLCTSVTQCANVTINGSPSCLGKIVNESIELPIYYQPVSEVGQKLSNENSFDHEDSSSTCNQQSNKSRYSDLYSNEAVKFKISTYGAHYNDNGIYRKLSLDSNSNCSIIASANGIFDSNGGILESADTGVSLNVPEGAIAPGCNFDLYFKVCHCKSSLTNGKGELLTNPIVMCGPRGIRFLKPVELQIPHFISIDGKSWSYAFKTSENISEEDPYSWTRFYKKTLINSVTVLLDSF